MTKAEKEKKESYLVMFDQARARNGIGMNEIEFIYFVAKKQPFKLGKKVNAGKYGSLSFKPLDLNRDDHMIVFKKNKIDNELQEKLMFDIEEGFDEAELDQIIQFLEIHARNVQVTEHNKKIIDDIFGLNSLSSSDSQGAYNKALEIMCSEFINGACCVSRALQFDEYMTGKKSKYSHPSLRKMYEEIEEFDRFDDEVDYMILLDADYYIIPKEDSMMMKTPVIDCDYFELIGTKDFVRKSIEERVIGEIELNDDGNKSDDGLKYCVMETVNNDKKKRLKVIVEGTGMDDSVKELYSIFGSKDYNEWLERGKLTDWTGVNDLKKLQDMRELKEIVNEKNNQIDTLKREILEKEMEDFE